MQCTVREVPRQARLSAPLRLSQRSQGWDGFRAPAAVLAQCDRPTCQYSSGGSPGVARRRRHCAACARNLGRWWGGGSGAGCHLVIYVWGPAGEGALSPGSVRRDEAGVAHRARAAVPRVGCGPGGAGTAGAPLNLAAPFCVVSCEACSALLFQGLHLAFSFLFSGD